MADASSFGIQHYSTDRHLTQLPQLLSTPQQPFHPVVDLSVLQFDRCQSHAQPNRSEDPMCHRR